MPTGAPPASFVTTGFQRLGVAVTDLDAAVTRADRARRRGLERRAGAQARERRVRPPRDGQRPRRHRGRADRGQGPAAVVRRGWRAPTSNIRSLLSRARVHRGRPLRARAGRRRAPAHRRAGRVRRSDARGAGWRRGAPHPRRLPHAGSRCRAAARREHARHVAAGVARRRSRPLVRAAGRARCRNDLTAGRDGDGAGPAGAALRLLRAVPTAKCSSSSNSRSERVPARVLRPAGRGAGHRVLRVPAVRHPHRRRRDRRGRRALRGAGCRRRRPRPHELVGVALPDVTRPPHGPRHERGGARGEPAGGRAGRARPERGPGAPVRGRHVRRRDVLRLGRLPHPIRSRCSAKSRACRPSRADGSCARSPTVSSRRRPCAGWLMADDDTHMRDRQRATSRAAGGFAPAESKRCTPLDHRGDPLYAVWATVRD